MSILEVNNVSKSFGGVKANVDISMSVEKGKIVGLIGPNGSGKTTTIGKLASQFRSAGKSVVIAAGDTFRAAAVEQLQVWGERAGVPVLTAPEGSDPASLAFDAMNKCKNDNVDLLMIDTAGRLQNRKDLMEELDKIVRVIQKNDPSAPHNTLLVLDATTGQNAIRQVEVFQEVSKVTGLVMTKLDGTAKGGVLVALADKFGLPIITLVDTPGAYPGKGAEERGQSEAIARSTEKCLQVRVPLISIITGEGGSGGAVAFATADKLLMLEHSVYSVISPEGCASILWKDSEKMREAAEALRLTAQDLKKLGVADKVMKEPLGGAQRDHKETYKVVKKGISEALKELQSKKPDALLKERRKKFLELGSKSL